jgi:hypothetical protein
MKMTRLNPILLGSLVLALPAVSGAATLAYWRFNEATTGNVPAGTGGEAAFNDTVLDSSGNNHHLRTWWTSSAPAYTTTVPSTWIMDGTGGPVSGNPAALSFDGGDDIYSAGSANSAALNAVNLTSFTIETWVRFNDLSGWETFIGRDDTGNPGQTASPESLLYFQKMGDGSNKIRFRSYDSAGAAFQVTTDNAIAANTWYHVAAVGNGTNVSLYLDGLQQGSPVAYSGGLFNPDPDTIWTLGRGQYAGGNGDFLQGALDETRISDIALAPSQFLIPEPSAALLGGLGILGLLRRRR